MKSDRCWAFVLSAFLLCAGASSSRGEDHATTPDASVPKDYFAEPANLPYDEEFQPEKQEDGWRWKEFRYTSLVYQGEPIRIHAVYALPAGTNAHQKLPAILMTHGIFGYSHNQPYWYAIGRYAKSGYAVLFIDWYPDYAAGWKPAASNAPNPYTTFGKLDYLKPWVNYWLEGNDWKDSLPYQFAMAGKRGLTWLQARPEVDGARLGATGASYGGIFSSMLAGVDPRIKAVNPCVYTAGFGKPEPSYNHLPEGWTDLQVASWRARFDSMVLLSQRSIPILYTVGSADTTFLLTRAMTTFAAMNEPKHLLIGPNRGHEYWDIDQGILFFDHALKGKFARPAIRNVRLERAGNAFSASADVSGDRLSKAEFYFTSAWEIDPDGGPLTVPSGQWKWVAVETNADGNGGRSVRWLPPVMHPTDARERLYVWGTNDVRSPADVRLRAEVPVAAVKLQGAARVFVRVTDTNGAMECSPISEAILFSDPPSAVAPAKSAPGSLPAFQAAVRVATNTVIDIHPDVPAGEAMAAIEALPVKAVGTHGYVLWNWQQKEPSTARTTDGVATPSMKLLPPFADTVKTNSFEGAKPWAANCRGGWLAFRLNGKLDTAGSDGRSWHGSVPPGLGGADEVTIEPQDATTHLLTAVVSATVAGECNVRVSVIGSEGDTAAVTYRHTSKADAVLQFRFKGTARLRVQMTSQPTADQYAVLLGPSALFLD